MVYKRFRPLEGIKNNFRCDFWNLQGQIRRSRYENWNNLEIRQKLLVHEQPYLHGILLI